MYCFVWLFTRQNAVQDKFVSYQWTLKASWESCHLNKFNTYFSLTLEDSCFVAPACEPMEAPAYGAILCGKYQNSLVNLCQPMCLDGYDVTFRMRQAVPGLYICSLDGQWFPLNFPAFNCTGEETRTASHSWGACYTRIWVYLHFESSIYQIGENDTGVSIFRTVRLL